MKQIHYKDESNKTQIVPTMELLGYRKVNTAYAVGDVCYYTDLPIGWYLKCTKAGTTSNSDLTINSPALNNTIIDGSVNWIIDTNTAYTNATTTTAGFMSAHDKAVLDNVPSSYATQTEVNQLATTTTNSVSAAVSAKNDAVAAKNQAQQIADGLVSIRDTAVDTSLAISGQAADSKTVGDKFAVIGATLVTSNEYLCAWLDSQNHVLFGVKRDGSFYFPKGIPKPINDEIEALKARVSALE